MNIAFAADMALNLHHSLAYIGFIDVAHNRRAPGRNSIVNSSICKACNGNIFFMSVCMY